jgi:hypothetical protein
MRFAGWERDLTKYFIVAIVFAVVLWLLFIPVVIGPDFDLLVDGSIQLIITLIGSSILAPLFYYLEEQFG